MAILKLEDGTIYTEHNEIARELSSLNVQINHWPVKTDPQLHSLLARESLSEVEKEQVLQALDHYFQELQRQSGYQSRDLIVLYPGLANLFTMLAQFNRPHTHADNEVRYILDGEAVFGFVRPDNSQVKLIVQPEEYINIPAGTEHWFHLTPIQRVKAVRYFTTTEGWIPEYTNAQIHFESASV